MYLRMLKCGLIQKQVLVEVISLVKMGHTRLGWALNPMTRVLMRREDTERGQGDIKMETEIEVMCLQAKHC